MGVRSYKIEVADRSNVSAHDFIERIVAGDSVEGLIPPPKSRFPNKHYRDSNISNCDWNSAFVGTRTFGGRFRPRFTNVTFESVNLTGSFFRHGDFSDCTFRSVAFDGKIMSSLSRCRFARCTFEDFELSGAVVTECRFDDCKIDATKVSDVQFKGCSFTSTVLTGLFREVAFTECDFNEFSVPDAELQSVTVSPVPRSGVALVDAPQAFFVPGADLQAISFAISDQIPREAAFAVTETAEFWGSTDMLFDSSILLQDLPPSYHDEVLGAAYAAKPPSANSKDNCRGSPETIGC